AARRSAVGRHHQVPSRQQVGGRGDERAVGHRSGPVYPCPHSSTRLSPRELPAPRASRYGTRGSARPSVQVPPRSSALISELPSSRPIAARTRSVSSSRSVLTPSTPPSAGAGLSSLTSRRQLPASNTIREAAAQLVENAQTRPNRRDSAS